MLSNIRFYILILTAIIAGGVYMQADGNVTRLTQTYALLGVTYLYIALMATPVTRFFPTLPGKGKYIKARRAIGVSAWCFGLLHAYFALFGKLGGLPGVMLLPLPDWAAVFAGSLSLTILTAMAATSTDWAVEKLGFAKWKALHRLVYVAGILILFHALTLGSHFEDLSGAIPRVFLVAVGILFVFETIRLVKYLQSKFKH